MKKRYTVNSVGYYDCPSFNNIEEARANLKELVKESLMQVRRKSKTATKHKISKDCYMITLGKDVRSALWAQHQINKY